MMDADADADVDTSPIDPTAVLDADDSTSASHAGATLGVPAATPATAAAAHRPLSSAAARFSRYLRAARHRRQRDRERDWARREDPAGYDATDPPFPIAGQTSLTM